MRQILALLVAALMLTIAVPSVSTTESAESEYFTTTGARIMGNGVAVSWRPCPYYAPEDPDDGQTTDYCLQGGDDPTGWSDPTDPGSGDPNGGDLWTGEEDDVVKMGGGPLQTPSGTEYQSVEAWADDDFFGDKAAGISACFWNPDGTTGNVCDDEDASSGTQCGQITLENSPFSSDSITIWVYTVVVEEDADFCFGFAGTFRGDFF